MNQENVYNITAYNLYDFLLEIQNGVKQGYVLSDKNEFFPQGFVSLYTCTLVKEEKSEEVVEIATTVAENTTEVTEPVKEVTLKDVFTNAQVKSTAGRKKVQK